MKNKYSYLLKNIGLFSISGFIPKILGFLLIPIYTGCLTTGEYGISDLITTTVSILIPIFTLGIQEAAIRFAMDKAYSREDVFSSAVRIVVGGTGLVCLGAFAVDCFHIPGIETLYLIFLVLMYFFTAANNCISLFCRGIDRVNVVVTGSVIHSAVTLLVNILVLLVFRWGLTGYLIANTVGAAVSLIYRFLAAKLYGLLKWRPSKAVAKEMVAYSFPLIFGTISWWINNASDRYILAFISGVAVSGVYAVSYKIPSLLFMFQDIFAQAWSISAIKEFDKDDSDGFISKMYTMMNFAMVTICSCIMIMNIPFARILYSNDFFQAWQFVPPLLISLVFNAMGLFIGGIFTAVKDTKTLSLTTVVGAVINILCNFVFIYFWSAYGAAIATLIGYFTVFLMRHVVLRKYIRLKLHWVRDVFVYGLLLAQMGLASAGLKLVGIQILILMAIPVLYWKEVRTLVKGLTAKLRR